jgi:hypothetical protein
MIQMCRPGTSMGTNAAFCLHLLLLVLVKGRGALAQQPVSVFPSGIGGFPCVRVPSLVAIPGGPLLAFAECRSFKGDGCMPHGFANASGKTVKDRVICMRTSTTGGRTWGQLMPNISRGRGMYPTALFDTSSGSLLLQFSSWPGTPEPNYHNPTPMQIVSTNHGKSWSAPVPVLPPAPHGVPPSIYLGGCRGSRIDSGPHAGRLLFTGYNHSLSADDHIHGESHAFVWFSDKGGIAGSWRRSPSDLRFMAEPQLAVLPAASAAGRSSGGGVTSGKAPSSSPGVALYGRSNGQMGCKCQNVAHSFDAGTTWSQASNVTSLPSPDCLGSVLVLPRQQRSAVWGLYSGPDSSTERTNMTVFANSGPSSSASSSSSSSSSSASAALGGGWEAALQLGSPTAMGSYSCLEDLQPLLHHRRPPPSGVGGVREISGDAAATAATPPNDRMDIRLESGVAINPVGILWEAEQSKSTEQASSSGGSGTGGGGVTCEGGGCDIVFASFERPG